MDAKTPTNRDRLRKIVVDHLGVDISAVKDEASFIDDLGADSLDLIELVIACEEEFGIEVSDDDAEHVMTFADMVKLVDRLAK
jgi:acyl carrier protein